MANLKTLKTRIKSVKSTQKMTKAMKMVAASRLKKAKNAVEHSRPYAQKIQEMITDLSSNIVESGGQIDNFPLLTGSNNRSQKYLMIVISSDRGLCGGINSATVKFVKNHINKLISEGREVSIICIGRKAYEQLKNLCADKIIDHFFGIFKSPITHQVAEKIANKIIELHQQNKFDICQVVFSKFKSAISQEQNSVQLIPAPIAISKKTKLHSPITYEPSQEAILNDLLPKNIAIQIYNFLLENNASEHGARMAAMESATNNAGKMIKNLTLVYNRTRQANITKELIDIISGANAV
jgi:F-type H+-transporting ATPase subunit gamma